ncbi:MAG: UvrB/UvrC motif-containing protein [Victivallaceae bacterium]|jgi:protein arginine kinase activator
MLCDACKKNDATIHIQEIISGQKKTIHLCGECAAKKSGDNPAMEIGGFNIAEMLYNLTEKLNIPGFQQALQQGGAAPAPEKALVCPACGWTTEGLRNSGRLGCPECYNTFRDILEGALENMHRGKLHVGKKPGSDSSDESPRLMLELMNYQKELEELVQREEYEKAAKVRDTINELKKKIKK